MQNSFFLRQTKTFRAFVERPDILWNISKRFQAQVTSFRSKEILIKYRSRTKPSQFHNFRF